MSLGKYSDEFAHTVFNQLIDVNPEIGNFVKNIVESISSKKLEFDIQTLIIHFLNKSIEKDIIGLINIIHSNYELISGYNDILFTIAMDFYIEIISDADVRLINAYTSDSEFNIFEMVQSIRLQKGSDRASLSHLLGILAKNKTCKKTIKKKTGVDLSKIKKQYLICNLCKMDAKFQCGKCNTTRYCSIICQHADWRRHKMVCTIIK
jgi:hypothetical protein